MRPSFPEDPPRGRLARVPAQLGAAALGSGCVETFLYLTTTGRVSGQPRTIEIWFVERDGRFYVVSEHGEASKWVKNLAADPRVRFRVGPRDAPPDAPTTAATARVVREPDLVAQVRALMDAKYDWSGDLVVEIAPDTPR